MTDKSKTAISVQLATPPAQQDPDVVFETTIADMTGYREPPGDDDDDENADDHLGSRYQAHAVTPGSYDSVLAEQWKPRFKATLPDKLTAAPDSTVNVDIAFQRRSKFWPMELDESPEIRETLAIIDGIDRLQSALSRQPTARKKLARLIQDLLLGE